MRKSTFVIATAILFAALMGTARAGTIAPDTLDAVRSQSKKLGFPLIGGTVVYCVDPQTGIVDQMWVVSSSQAVSCPGSDTFLIERKSTKFIEVVQ
ncbi:MAG TPA: hypothetical protein VMV27_07630 [Candidatus Binataceae bacterium]|nr:hypothetical protein [Candidatus Binataceae bacterium]